MRLKNGLTTKGTAFLGLDWSRIGVYVYDPRDNKVRQYKTIEQAAAANPGCSIVFEATAESFELSRRDAVLQSLKENGIDAYVYNTRYTKIFRLKHGIEKTDPADAKVIYRVATETNLSLHRFGPLRDGDPLGSRISEFVITDRSVHKGKTSLPYAEKYLGKILPKRQRAVSIVPEFFQPWIYDSQGKYRTQVGRILFVAEQVRKDGRGYREFRRQLGNYGNGLGRIMRSEINWWWTRPRLLAKMKSIGLKAEKKSVTKNGQTVSVRTWPQNELSLKRETMNGGVKAAQYLWRLTEN